MDDLSQPKDDDADAGDAQPERREFTDAEVDVAFSAISHKLVEDSLPGPRDYVAAEEDDRFIPPDPGPVSSADPFLNLGWALLAGGLLTILLSLMVWPGAPRTFHLACVAAIAIGAGVLVWRMPRDRDHDDDDLGAVV